jgi:hypothetical protein
MPSRGQRCRVSALKTGSKGVSAGVEAVPGAGRLVLAAEFHYARAID